MNASAQSNDSYAEMLSAEKAVLVMIDHQAGLMLFPGDIEPVDLRNNSIALAKVAKMHNLPVLFSAADQGPRGPIGPIIPEINALHPEAPIVYRTKINVWHDAEFRSALESTGRTQVIICGIDASFCQGLPAKSMVADGYSVWSCIDCSGNISTLTRASTIANLTQAGVRCTNWVDVACQLLADWAADEAKSQALLDIYAEHLPQWSMLDMIDRTRKSILTA